MNTRTDTDTRERPEGTASTGRDLSPWERAKIALARDWNQTRYDLGVASGEDLHQRLSDTVRQVAGSEPIPPEHAPNPPLDLTRADEAAMRFGYISGVSPYYRTYASWDATLEARLFDAWAALYGAESWEVVRDRVRQAFERTREST